MDYDTFMDLMCCDDDNGMCEEFIRKQATPKGYLKSILTQVYDMSSDYKWDNISENNYISNLEQCLDIDLILSPPNWYGSKVDIYNEVKSTLKKIQDSSDIISEDCESLHDILLLMKKPIEEGDITANYARYIESIRLATINGYNGNSKFINTIR